VWCRFRYSLRYSLRLWQLEISKTGRTLNHYISNSFTTCSARLPVYAIIIALVIPDTRVGIFNLQGLTLMLLYLLGFEWLSAYVLNKIMKIKARLSLWSKCPLQIAAFKNVAMSLKNKSICIWRRKNNFAISIVLWFLLLRSW
jgi:ferrous iron transport protein B